MSRLLARQPPPAHRATTASLQAAYPFAASGSPLRRGVYIGQDVYGGAFLYDPFLAYDAGLIGSPNMLIIGQLGSGKSALAKAVLVYGSLPPAQLKVRPWYKDHACETHW